MCLSTLDFGHFGHRKSHIWRANALVGGAPCGWTCPDKRDGCVVHGETKRTEGMEVSAAHSCPHGWTCPAKGGQSGQHMCPPMAPPPPNVRFAHFVRRRSNHRARKTLNITLNS